MADSVQAVRTDLTVLKKDVELNTNLLDKLEVTIDKLTDISNNLTKLVSVFSNRIDNHDDSIKNINSSMEKIMNRSEEKFQSLRDDILRLERDITSDIELNQKTLSDKLDNVKKDLFDEVQSKDTVQSSRITELEKFQWKFMGIGIVIGFIVTTVGPLILKPLFAKFGG